MVTWVALAAAAVAEPRSTASAAAAAVEVLMGLVLEHHPSKGLRAGTLLAAAAADPSVLEVHPEDPEPLAAAAPQAGLLLAAAAALRQLLLAL